VQEVARAVASEDETIVAGLLARYEARRNSMPAFMRELKQRFTSSIHEDVESIRARTTRIKDGLCSVAASQMMESSARK